ncbi:DUF814 domain-containing protein, partial [Candidatus Bathyarchaeota archaeon]|nr:DUF814 domain-containing protein [Candidatus Bathyarchaeota archaeon]
ALDEFYIRTKSVETTITAIDTEKPNREVKKLKRMIAEQEKTCREGEERAKNYRSIGDSIYVNSSPLQTLFDKILSSRQEGKDWSVITSEIITAKDSGEVPCVFYESLDAKNSIIIVSVGSLKFSLSLRKTLFENAAGFYERGKRAKQKSVGAMRALDISRKKLTEIEAKVEEAEIRKSLVPTQVTQEIVKREIKRKEWYEKFRWFVSSDDFLVVAGKDAVSNEVVVKKYTDSNDIVFHADVVGAPFVVVKTGQKEPSPKVISEAGEFAASLSRGWREGFGSVDVYWVSSEQLSKAGPSGEYVPHGAFAIKGKRNWLRNVPLRTSIGIISADKIEIIGGPPESVKAKTKAYVTVLPNDKKDGALFKKILRILSSSLTEDQRKQIGKESLEKIREFVPYRKGRIVKKL